MSIWSSIIGGVAGILGIGAGHYSTRKQREQEWDIAQQNLQYQKDAQAQNLALQREAWQREDTAISRKVADLQANGLSKTLAAGSGAPTSSPIKVEALHNQYSPDKFNTNIAQMIQDAQQYAIGAEQIKNLKADNKLKTATAENLESQSDSIELDNDIKELNIQQKTLENAENLFNVAKYGTTKPNKFLKFGESLGLSMARNSPYSPEYQLYRKWFGNNNGYTPRTSSKYRRYQEANKR